MRIEADVSRPSKRFVLPYEPEYPAHRRDDRVSRITKLLWLCDEDLSPPITPELSASESPGAEKNLHSAEH
jgi:hypothetical protein